MLSNEIIKLENENAVLKNALEELSKKMEQNEVLKPKCCQYCKNYIQHYGKFDGRYSPIYAGHCASGAPISKGGKRKPKPDETCSYFELGTIDTRHL